MYSKTQMKIQKFEDLRIWQESHRLTTEIYKLTFKFPKSETFGIVSQIRRCSSSVPANIVEGFYRDTTKELIKFLFNARGSAGEVTYFLMLAKELDYISEIEYSKLRLDYEKLLASISSLINKLRKK